MRPIELPYLSELVALRRDLHAHPELAYKETRTAEIVARELAAYGLEVHRGLAGTGVVGILRKGGKRHDSGKDGDRNKAHGMSPWFCDAGVVGAPR